MPLLRMMLPTKPAPDYAFDDQMICRAGSADADSEIELPLGRDVQIDRREELLLLLGHGIESGNWAKSAIILQAAAHHLGEIVRDFKIRRELKAHILVLTVDRLFDCRIER